MKFTQIATAIALGLALSTAAQAAGTANDNFNVKITINGTCDLTAFTANATSDVVFTAVDATATSAIQQATNSAGTRLAVLCSKGQAATLGLTPSNANVNGAGVMAGTVPNTDTIAYTLTQPTGGPSGPFVAAYATAWGNDPGVNTLAITGTGLASGDELNIPVNATIAANLLNVTADSYTDPVVATLTY